MDKHEIIRKLRDAELDLTLAKTAGGRCNLLIPTLEDEIEHYKKLLEELNRNERAQ
jgi:hypothetical protein